ncbi:hypothetical protein LshimejAT787_2500530 [Lyophyllum shimeji]|uniref:Uncharacterized protein n=1 Tax=Lyophyllum shimeji TaxID=47721 RepID=A0A9P3Q2U7_LYOSH|nr:hypothetical protein LshimejAT787_2500530 [Lyophyllum shimeji]
MGGWGLESESKVPGNGTGSNEKLSSLQEWGGGSGGQGECAGYWLLGPALEPQPAATARGDDIGVGVGKHGWRRGARLGNAARGVRLTSGRGWEWWQLELGSGN